jgi:hypothetical protein
MSRIACFYYVRHAIDYVRCAIASQVKIPLDEEYFWGIKEVFSSPHFPHFPPIFKEYFGGLKKCSLHLIFLLYLLLGDLFLTSTEQKNLTFPLDALGYHWRGFPFGTL